MADYYAVLGIDRGASSAQVEAAFSSRMMDSGSFQRKDIVRAYAVLSNPQKRAAYDASLPLEEHAAPAPSAPKEPPSPLISGKIGAGFSFSVVKEKSFSPPSSQSRDAVSSGKKPISCPVCGAVISGAEAGDIVRRSALLNHLVSAKVSGGHEMDYSSACAMADKIVPEFSWSAARGSAAQPSRADSVTSSPSWGTEDHPQDGSFSAKLVLLVLAALAVYMLWGRLSALYSSFLPSRPAPSAVSSEQKTAAPGMVFIPPGTFMMGASGGKADFPDEMPAHEVFVQGFQIDAREVTYGDFAVFADSISFMTSAELAGAGIVYDGVGDMKAVPGASWRNPAGDGAAPEDREKLPVVQVSWNDAAAYCSWAGKRLPTEAEWERAATYASVSHNLRPEAPAASSWFADTGAASLMPAGSRPPDSSGLYDMFGNASEWTADYFSPDYYSRSPKENPRGPSAGDSRVIRGGAYWQYLAAFTPQRRAHAPQQSSSSFSGFRCAR